MEQYQVVRVGQQEFFIDQSGTWFLRMPTGLGVVNMPRIAFGLPQQHELIRPAYIKPLVRPSKPMYQTAVIPQSRGSRPNERGVQVRDQAAPNQEEIQLQELGKPKKDFLKDIANVLDSVGNVIGNFKKHPRQQGAGAPQPMQRTVVLPANQNSKSGMFDNFTMTQKVALGGAALLIVGLVVNQAQKK